MRQRVFTGTLLLLGYIQQVQILNGNFLFFKREARTATFLVLLLLLLQKNENTLLLL